MRRAPSCYNSLTSTGGKSWLWAGFAALAWAQASPAALADAPRARDLGAAPGVLPPGRFNAITDVPGVRVGHRTLIQGESVRTGVTVIVPHAGNIYQDKVPAGIAVGNGFGKFMGATQIEELGEIETPIALTNTLSVPAAAAGLIDWTLRYDGNESVKSVNAVVGETNDGTVNDIRARVVQPADVDKALAAARSGAVEEGNVGAGTGTHAFSWKGGIGTSSRVLPQELGGYTVGTLVQTNYGGLLSIMGVPVQQALQQQDPKDPAAQSSAQAGADGSIIIVIATDAPLSDRNLKRLANRAFLALGRTGSWMSNGSGDYAIAFSVAEGVRRTPERRRAASTMLELPNDAMSPLFQAVVESTEEAIYNAIVAAESMEANGARLEKLPLDSLERLLRGHGFVPPHAR